jgi:hypothetical protein
MFGQGGKGRRAADPGDVGGRYRRRVTAAHVIATCCLRVAQGSCPQAVPCLAPCPCPPYTTGSPRPSRREGERCHPDVPERGTWPCTAPNDGGTTAGETRLPNVVGTGRRRRLPPLTSPVASFRRQQRAVPAAHTRRLASDSLGLMPVPCYRGCPKEIATLQSDNQRVPPMCRN